MPSIISCVSEYLDGIECYKDADRVSDKPEKYRGAPVSLQLIGRRYEDEKVSEHDSYVRATADRMLQVVEAMDYIKNSIGLPFVNFV